MPPKRNIHIINSDTDSDSSSEHLLHKTVKKKQVKAKNIKIIISDSDSSDSDESSSSDVIKKQVVKKNNDKLTMIDLCAGTGAFSYAFESTNKVKIVFSNDIEPASKLMYDANFDHELTLGNICNTDVKTIPKHDILTAGIPCQPFSIAGKQKGFDDPRSNVFWKILEIVKYHKPKCIILENVKNLESHDNGDTLKTIKSSLKKEKYHIIHKVLNTSTITTVPQHRERIYIVCIKDKKVFDNFNLDFPKVKKQNISKMLTSKKVDKKYYYTNEENKIHRMVMEAVVEEDTVYQFRRIYVRENKNNECPTLTANMGSGGHNVPIILDGDEPRKLIPKECFNFQGFPKDYILPKLADCKLYKLAGNAVSVPVVKLIADRLVKLL
jgi:DNA (cytosine-5)-methyltransferase 1